MHGQSQNQGFSGRTRIILPGEGEDPNRVIIPGLHSENTPYNNQNNMYPNSNNMYPNNNNMYPNNNNMYPNTNNYQNNPNNINNNMYPNNNNNNNNLYNNPNNMNSNANINQNNRNNLFQNNRNNMFQNNRNLNMNNNNRNFLPPGDPRCMMQYGGYTNNYSMTGSCSLCSRARLVSMYQENKRIRRLTIVFSYLTEFQILPSKSLLIYSYVSHFLC